jgi:sec-independent protein translocase protein TatA
MTSSLLSLLLVVILAASTCSGAAAGASFTSSPQFSSFSAAAAAGSSSSRRQLKQESSTAVGDVAKNVEGLLPSMTRRVARSRSAYSASLFALSATTISHSSSSSFLKHSPTTSRTNFGAHSYKTLLLPASLINNRQSNSQNRRGSTALNGFFGLGGPEIAVIGLAAAFLLGPSKLSEFSKDLGKIAGELKDVPKEFQKGLQEGEAESRAINAKIMMESSGGSTMNNNVMEKKEEVSSGGSSTASGVTDAGVEVKSEVKADGIEGVKVVEQ